MNIGTFVRIFYKNEYIRKLIYSNKTVTHPNRAFTLVQMYKYSNITITTHPNCGYFVKAIVHVIFAYSLIN